MASTDEIEPHIYKKFDILEKKGKGAYGIVWKVIEKKTKKICALKKVFDAFHNDTDAQRTFREIMLLQELNGHENIIKLLNVIKAENNKDIYLVFEYMEIDLHHVNRADILQDIHKVYIVYQLLKCLKYLHSGDIIHRDLKPANLLLDAECNLKVADFGLARSISDHDTGACVMTDYVATRWYRAPEIVLGSTDYSKAVDMWSVGCILGEILLGKALFPGKSTMNQIELIMGLLGRPSKDELDGVNAATDIDILEVMQIKKKYSFSKLFKYASKEAVDFLRKTLVFDPNKRMTVDEALRHPFVADFYKNDKVLSCPKKIILPIRDETKLSLREYREALYADILKKKKEQRKKWKMKYLQKLGITNDDLKGADMNSMMAKKKRERERVKHKERNPYKPRESRGQKKEERVKSTTEYNKKMAHRSAYTKGMEKPARGEQRETKNGASKNRSSKESKYGDYATYKYYKANKEKYRKK